MRTIEDIHLLYNCLKTIVKFVRDKARSDKVFYLVWKCEKPKEFGLFEAVDVSVCSDVSNYVKSLIMYPK